MSETTLRNYGPVVPAGVDSKAVRAWAKEIGLLSGSRGRIAQSVIDAYLAEHPEA